MERGERGADTAGEGALKVGLIGYGLGGAVFHAPLVAATPDLELTSIVTSDPGRQDAARGRYPGARILPTADDLWAAAGEHDLVVISTVNRAHVPLGLAAIDVGLAVVMDKPVAPTAADGERLAAAARGRGVPFTVG
ncbi:MAG: Gfo/Idh/MocA family protein, partial [Actinomycetota bacterium]